MSFTRVVEQEWQRKREQRDMKPILRRRLHHLADRLYLELYAGSPRDVIDQLLAQMRAIVESSID